MGIGKAIGIGLVVGVAGVARAEPPTAAEVQEERTDQLEDEVLELRQRVTVLEQDAQQSQSQAQAAQEAHGQLQEQVNQDQQARAQREEDRQRRIVAFDSAIAALDRARAVMDSGTVEVEQLRWAAGLLSAVVSNASAQGGESEARVAQDAEQWMGAAVEALTRSDLYQAKVGLEFAIDRAARARALAEGGPAARY